MFATQRFHCHVITFLSSAPLLVCGDGICSAEIDETCDTCATDCCGIVFPAGATAGIVCVGVLIPIIVVAAILGVS